jgi:HK97 family phage major capsid protein
MATKVPANGNLLIDEVWAKEIQEARRNKLVAWKLVDTQYESGLLRHGDTVHILAMPDLTADTIVPGTPITPVAPTETEQTLVVDQYKGKAVVIQDMLTVQSNYELRNRYTGMISRAIAEAMDSYILGLWSNFASGNILAAVANITFNTIIDAHQKLDAANVPQTGRSLIVDSLGLADLRKVAEFTMYDKTGRAGLVTNNADADNPGFVGTIYGAPVYWTNAVPKAGGSAKMLLIHNSAIAGVVQLKPEVENDRDILLKADIVSGSTLFGAKVVRPDHAVVIQRTEA